MYSFLVVLSSVKFLSSVTLYFATNTKIICKDCRKSAFYSMYIYSVAVEYLFVSVCTTKMFVLEIIFLVLVLVSSGA